MNPKTDLIVFHKSYEDTHGVIYDITRDIFGLTNDKTNPLYKLIPKTPNTKSKFLVTVRYIEESE